MNQADEQYKVWEKGFINQLNKGVAQQESGDFEGAFPKRANFVKQQEQTQAGQNKSATPKMSNSAISALYAIHKQTGQLPCDGIYYGSDQIKCEKINPFIKNWWVYKLSKTGWNGGIWSKKELGSGYTLSKTFKYIDENFQKNNELANVTASSTIDFSKPDAIFSKAEGTGFTQKLANKKFGVLKDVTFDYQWGLTNAMDEAK